MRERAEQIGGVDSLCSALNAFRCCKDLDIELFLREKVWDYVERRYCSVYLILDEEQFDHGSISVLAYFTLSHKAVIPSNASKTSIQKASGNKKSETIPFVLIGQLGKYMEQISKEEVYMADISGEDILSYVYEVIGEADSLIPCRCMMVECSDSEKVQNFYIRNGFKFLQQDGRLYQFFKAIHN